MSNESNETQMIRYECQTCEMSATCVRNEASSLAWLDHMAGHVVQDGYQAWTWTVVPLDLT